MPEPKMSPLPRTGFAVPCPHCGAKEGLLVNIHDLALNCADCSEPVTRATLSTLIEDARRLLSWLNFAEFVTPEGNPR